MAPSSETASCWRRPLPCYFLAACLPIGSGTMNSSGKDVLDILFMADIGHPREFADTLNSPWPMGKSSNEGAFSLYEGIYDFVQNQGERPQAILVMGDVGYCGGDAACNNKTRDAFQKYTNSQVPANMVFPSIGNHDVHYLGCSWGEYGGTDQTCHYGTGFFLSHSVWQMTFEQWRQNWLKAFPGLVDSIILPPPCDRPSASSQWLAPLRYNIDFGRQSKVYFMSGLLAGVFAKRWNGDTPAAAVESTADLETAELECQFLRDSVAHGRRLGKTVFIYLTHYMDGNGCRDWSVIQQIDVWLYGHKHRLWQSPAKNAVQIQENRHYPMKVLIGNGGFDEARIDIVSFGRLREEHFFSRGEFRLRLRFDIFDTCRSPEGTCPSSSISPLAQCWGQCTDVPGGYDNGGGPRRASPNQYGLGFTLEAPLKRSRLPSSSPTYRLKLGDGDMAQWLALGTCGSIERRSCIAGRKDASQAVLFTVYDTVYGALGRSFTARLAIDDERRTNVAKGGEDEQANWLIPNPHGFWQDPPPGTVDSMEIGWRFNFTRTAFGWQIEDVSWESNSLFWGTFGLQVQPGKALSVIFQADDMMIIV